MFLATEPNPNLVYVIAALPATLIALATFWNTVRIDHKNDEQHARTAEQVQETKHLLITHAAKMGTVERRAVRGVEGAVITDPLPSNPVVTAAPIGES